MRSKDIKISEGVEELGVEELEATLDHWIGRFSPL